MFVLTPPTVDATSESSRCLRLRSSLRRGPSVAKRRHAAGFFLVVVASRVDEPVGERIQGGVVLFVIIVVLLGELASDKWKLET